ncbi:MAG: histone deacetylase [Elusimicrobiota bacterium]
MAKLIYSEKYQVDIGAHVFPTRKYKLIKERLIKEGPVKEKDFTAPQPAGDEDILLVHTPDYLRKLKTGNLNAQEILKLELPYSPWLVEASLICVGGSILAAAAALTDGVGMHIGGGFHHAFPDHGEGFCVLNDIAVAIRKMQKEKKIKKAMTIDCDLHQGNGTAAIFRNDQSVFTFSIHQENNYPAVKPPSSLDIGLADGAGDQEYLMQLEKNIPEIIKKFQPELAVYVAGADVYKDDLLGGLSLTIGGLKKRDQLIKKICRENNLPVMIVLAGGYARDVGDTVEIHGNTVKTFVTG